MSERHHRRRRKRGRHSSENSAWEVQTDCPFSSYRIAPSDREYGTEALSVSGERRRQTALMVGEVAVMGFETREEIWQPDFPGSCWMREDNRSFLFLRREFEVWERE